ncbi:hypothetical protein [Promicromonospora sp. NPDC060271]|uniref:hypothetical protein n=1 Tax=Promicromonospora sp. NPDC060271 TaxID=3347089 RepID=UPI00364E65C5
MKRSMIAGATAAGLLFGALATPATVAVSAEVSTVPPVDCGSTARSEAEAAELAAACDKDVEVHGVTDDGARLFAEPNGVMRLEASSVEHTIESRAAVRTVLRSSGTSGYGWTGQEWVGYCNPAESASSCATAGTQRLAWQFDGLGRLAGLEPEDITSATFSANMWTIWLDSVECTPNRLDLYDIPQISADTDWASTELWTEDRHVGGNALYASTCEQTPRYSVADRYRDFDAMEVARRAARDDRSSVTLGLAAPDETCMTCGWNKFQTTALLVVRFNDRAPLTPSNLEVGSRNTGNLPCTGEAVFRTTTVYIETYIVDPDDPTGTDGSIPATTGTFRLARADTPDKVVWEEHAKNFPLSSNRYLVYIAGGTMTQGRYVLSVFGTDGYGQVGPSATCEFSIDFTSPEPPVVTPVVGGQAVYTKGSSRGGVGVPGSFLIDSPSSDIRTYRYGINSQTAAREIAPTENTVLNFTPTRSGRNYLTVEAIDRAGNRSVPATYEFYVGSGSTATTPPAITVTGPTSFTFGDVPTALVTLSKDAVTPYGTVTVKSGSTTVGSVSFDERTEELSLDGPALGVGTKTLTFTYSAFPDAPAWSTQRTVTIKPPAFSTPISPSVSGTPRVGRTLTATRGPWTPEPTTVKYQWRLDGRAVSGATAYNWKLPASAKGKAVSVAITGSKTGYETKTVVSPATAAVMAGVFVAPTPTIAGSATVGSTLQVYRGTWTPLPSTVTHQWKIDGRSVEGATRSTFRVPTSARGKRVSVVVTGSLAGYTTKSVSQSTGLIR